MRLVYICVDDWLATERLDLLTDLSCGVEGEKLSKYFVGSGKKGRTKHPKC